MQRRSLTRAAASVFVLLLSSPAWAGYQAGLNAYSNGDDVRALKELRPLALAGDARAQDILAIMYYSGEGLPLDRTEAARWFRLAAEQDHMIAQRILGRLYREGIGVPQDFAEAMRWYHRAAAQGDLSAKYSLGMMYAKGLGGPQDEVKAYMWYSIAHAQGQKDKLARHMTSDQIAEAERLVRRWKPRPLRSHADYCKVHFPSGTAGCPDASSPDH